MEQVRSSPRRPKKEDCFEPPVASFVNDEFDFEKNLALFDKRAVFAAIESENDSPMHPAKAQSKDHKYRCDENVLPSKPAIFRQIKTDAVDTEFVTDLGLVVPSVSREVRSRLLKLAADKGLSTERQIEAVGRSAAEMVLQLLGGSAR
jgi:enhancer of mRNA-decapping protein 3